MAKRLSEKQKLEIVEGFLNNKTIEFLSEKYNFTKLTVSRNLKKSLGEKKYKEIVNKENLLLDNISEEKLVKNEKEFKSKIQDSDAHDALKDKSSLDKVIQIEPFIEIAPLDHDFEAAAQKDLSSVPLSEVKLPDVVYLIVKKEIELETKFLGDYPEWQFLPQQDLKRKTLEIYFDLKTAKRSCNKDQKVIKVPNADVFRIVSPILLSRGISRLITSENLISI